MRKRLLVVENNKETSNNLAKYFDDLGYEVISATHIYSTYQLLTYAPSVIVLDERLGDLYGYQLCKVIKKDPESQYIPVILLSSMPNIDQIATSCRADTYVKKPFDLDQILSAIKSCLFQHTNAETYS